MKALSWEKPHLQLADITPEQLLGGSYPDGADDGWAQNFTAAIECWTGFPAAPGIPGLIVERSALSDLHSDNPEKPPTEIPALQVNTGFRVIARQGLLLRGGP